jgi:Putative rhamnosyl transferase
MNAVDHVLLTRFNVPSQGHESLVRAQESWLRDRVELFERYCLPSVRAQTRQAFTWLVYFDPASPAWLRDWVAGHEAAGAFRPLYREEVPRETLIADIRAAVGPAPAAVLLTTNLDNDDALAADFVARLQDAVVSPVRSALYVGDGLIGRGTRLYRRTDPHNAFCSVREPWDEPVTCWADWHNLLPRQMPAVVLRGDPGWLQVVHGANVSNRVRGRLTRPSTHAATFPGRLADLPDPSRSELVGDALLAGPLRVVREAARAAVKVVVHRLLGPDGLDRAKRSWLLLSPRGAVRGPRRSS